MYRLYTCSHLYMYRLCYSLCVCSYKINSLCCSSYIYSGTCSCIVVVVGYIVSIDSRESYPSGLNAWVHGCAAHCKTSRIHQGNSTVEPRYTSYSDIVALGRTSCDILNSIFQALMLRTPVVLLKRSSVKVQARMSQILGLSTSIPHRSPLAWELLSPMNSVISTH